MNAIRCLICGDVIESKHRHDFQVCSCWTEFGGGCAVDGGNDYKRRIGSNFVEVDGLLDGGEVVNINDVMEEIEGKDDPFNECV